MKRILNLVASGAILFAPVSLFAQTTLRVAADGNATVRPSGVRTGSSGLIFFNVQGSANGSFASFGVVDFSASVPGASSITDLSLELTQSNASFTANGAFSVYLTDETTVSILENVSPLTYQGGDGVGSVDPLLTNLQFLGSFNFVEIADGTIDSVDLFSNLDPSEASAILSALQLDETIRLVLVSDVPTVSATYAGQGNFDGPAPTLVVEYTGAAAPVAVDAFVNEIHYDNVSTDTGEFVEIAGLADESLAGWQLVLYNGTSSVRGPYNTITFGGADIFVADANSNDFGFVLVELPTNGIQNGAPDGLALVDPAGTVVQFLSYEGTFEALSGPAAGQTSTDIGVSESSSTPAGFSLQLTGSGRSASDFIWAPEAAETRGTTNNGQSFVSGPTFTVRSIMEIQGAGHTSPDVGLPIETTGIVTAVGIFDAVGRSDEAGFYLQDPTGDGSIATSDAVFVVSAEAVALGDEVTVRGIVEESGFSRELTYTRILASSAVVNSSGNPLPTPVLLGSGGRTPPTENIDDDAFASFDPDTDGLDFFESLEAMRVTVQSARAISPTNRFNEIFVVVDDGAGATGISARGTLNISPDDFNPEKIQIDPGREDFDPAIIPLPPVDVGARLGNVTGVVGYDFGNFQVQPEGTVVATPGTVTPVTTSLAGSPTDLLIATYNVLNLDPNPLDDDDDVGAGRFDAIASQIVASLAQPDIIGLQEVQDNSGSDDDGVVAADQTLQALVDAIVTAGGPAYQFIDNTFITNNNSGGQPGGNIRVAFLYNPARVSLVPGTVRTVADRSAFAGARLPLIADFDFDGNLVTVVTNHFSSKGGSAPIFGTEQPFEARQEEVAVNGSLDERLAQSGEVRNFIDATLAADPNANLVVLGDLNEFEFVSPVSVNLGGVLENLTLRIAEDERYTFNFQGNSQSLDHILVSSALSPRTDVEIAYVNSEFADTGRRASDHDPMVAVLSFAPPVPVCDGKPATVYVDANGIIVGGPQSGHPYKGVLAGTFSGDVIVGTSGDDVILGLSGSDVVCGEDGDDALFGGLGNDRLFGGAGDDLIIGGPGRDRLDGGADHDRCIGGRGSDGKVDCE